MNWCFIIIILYICVKSAAERAKILQFVIWRDYQSGGGDLVCSGGPFDVVVNETYKIQVNYTQIYKQARCGRDNTMKKVVMARGKGDYYISGAMSEEVKGSWYYVAIFFTEMCDSAYYNKCYFGNYNEYEDPGVKCQTMIHVHEPEEIIVKPEGRLTANTKTFPTTRVEQHYYFHDGEGTMFTCHKTTGKLVALTLTTLAGRFETTNYQTVSSVDMYIKLTASMAGTKIKCMISDGPRQEDVTIILTLDKQGFAAFVVNGLIPPLKSNDTNSILFYEYIFREDEELAVSFIKDTTVPSSCYVYNPSRHAIPFSLEQNFKNSAKSMDHDVVKFLLNEGGKDTSITCTLNNMNYTIKFIFHQPSYKPYFSDLSMSNISLNFRNTSGNFIFLESAVETFSIDCLVHEPTGGTIVTDHYKPGLPYYVNMSSKRKLTMTPDENRGSLACFDAQYINVIRRTASQAINGNTENNQEIPALPDQSNPNPIKTEHETTIPPPARHPDLDSGNPNNRIDQNSSTRPGQDETNLSNEEVPNHIKETKDFLTKEQIDNSQKYTINRLKDGPESRCLKPFCNQRGGASNKKQPKPATPNTLSGQKKKNQQFSVNSSKKRVTNSLSNNKFTGSNTQSSVKPTGVSPKPNTSKIEASTASGNRNPTTGNTGVTTPTPELKLEPSAEPNSYSGESAGSGHTMIVVSVVLVILLLAAVLWLAHSFRKKHRLRKHDPNMDYQNLPDHLEGTMATPSQWDNRPDDVTYSHPVVENLYTVPVAKAYRRNNPNPEPLYSQPRDSTQNITYENSGNTAQNSAAGYATIGNYDSNYAAIGQNEPGYASVHESIANSSNNRLVANPAEAKKYENVQPNPQDTYAQVQKKHLRNAAKNGTGKDPCQYQNIGEREIKPASDKNRVLPQLNYANVEDLKSDQCGYVNTDMNDAVEPTYTELSK